MPRKLRIENSIEYKRPWMLAEWNYCINPDPSTISANSNEYFTWTCMFCGESWEAKPICRNMVGCITCQREMRARQRTIPKPGQSLADLYPDLIENEWDWELNDKSPKKIHAHSKYEAHWICPICKSSYIAPVHYRTCKDGRKYCRNCGINKMADAHSIPREGMSLLDIHPEIANELHPTLNNGLEACSISVFSNKKVWWICELGHEYEAPVCNRTTQNHGCPYCSGQKVLAGFNDLGTVNPELAAEWHRTRNNELEPSDVTAGSHKKVWWICQLGHEYEATVKDRVAGNGCPYCANKKVLIGFNDLATTHPDIAREWDYMKNGELTPTAIVAGSTKVVSWVCGQGHSYDASPHSRTVNGSNCPYCSNKKVLPGFNDLATTAPDLAAEWNKTRNGSLTPQSVTRSSGKRVWWICKHGHEWEAFINNRNAGTGCPYCAGKKVLVGFNDLATLIPEVAAEWNYYKNGNITPYDVTCFSNKEYWWKCDKGHTWKASVCARSSGSGCPRCMSYYQSSFPEKALYYYVSNIFHDAKENAILKETQLGKKELDIWIPSINTGIEYDGQHWHVDANNDLLKDEACNASGIKLIRVREPNCPEYETSATIIHRKSLTDSGLEEAIREVILTLGYDKSIDIDINRDRYIILALRKPNANKPIQIKLPGM